MGKYTVYIGLQLRPEEMLTKYRIALNIGTQKWDFAYVRYSFRK
jgi:hypothetical protein